MLSVALPPECPTTFEIIGPKPERPGDAKQLLYDATLEYIWVSVVSITLTGVPIDKFLKHCVAAVKRPRLH